MPSVGAFGPRQEFGQPAEAAPRIVGRVEGSPPIETWRSRLGWYAAWLVAAPFAVFGSWYATQVGLGYDSHAYWSAVQDMDHLYGASALTRDAYLYSPLFAQAIWPLGRLPWPVFGVVWAILQAAVFVWLLRPLPARWRLPALVATVPEILTGNIYALMASALVLGATRGAPWVFLALTKVSPGLVGVAWLPVGRRWRSLLTGTLVGTALVGLSYLAAPTTWQDWLRFLASGRNGAVGPSGVPWLTLTLLVAGLAVTVFAALTRRGWLLSVATIMVSPTFGPNTLTLLSAVPRLARDQRRRERGLDEEHVVAAGAGCASRADAGGRQRWPSRWAREPPWRRFARGSRSSPAWRHGQRGTPRRSRP